MEIPDAGGMSSAARERQPDLRERSARVERLLDEVQAMVGPPAWQRVEDLVSQLVSLYGTGLARLLTVCRESADPRLVEQLCRDEMVSSLLLLHGLHPLTTEQRVRRALDGVRPYLGSHAGGVELLGIEGSGVVRLRLVGTCHGCPSSRVTVEHAIRRAIEEAAPEASGVEVEGAEPQGSGRVGLRIRRDAPEPGSRWVELDGVQTLPAGGRLMRQLGHVSVAVFRHEEALLAYRNACAGCGARFDGSAVDAHGVLTCARCARRFELPRAGRGLGGEDAVHLVPLPLLVDEVGARVAIPETAQ